MAQSAVTKPLRGFNLTDENGLDPSAALNIRCIQSAALANATAFGQIYKRTFIHSQLYHGAVQRTEKFIIETGSFVPDNGVCRPSVCRYARS